MSTEALRTGSPSAVGQRLAELDAPPAVVNALDRLCRELVAAAKDNLAGLIVYGSLARRRFRPNRSDVNVAVVLREVSGEALAKIAAPLRSAWRAVRVEPFVLAVGEAARLAVSFPIKMLEIQAHHVLLYGDDPFNGLTVDRRHIRLRLDQQLRNLGLRLRRRYLAIVEDAVAIADVLASAARDLAVDLATLLHLTGKETPAEDRTDAILAAAAQAFQLDAEVLARVTALRREIAPPDDLSKLYDRFLTTIARVVAIVDRLEAAP